MYLVYILFSDTLSKYYVGSTQDLERRIQEHNRGKSLYTRKGIPWALVYQLKFITRSEAINEEIKIKKRGISRYFKDLGIK